MILQKGERMAKRMTMCKFWKDNEKEIYELTTGSYRDQLSRN